MAPALYHSAPRWVAGWPTPRRAAHGDGCGHGPDRHPDLGDESRARDALEHARHGPDERGKPEYRVPHLAGLWPAAASDRVVQAVGRSAVRREGPGYCRVVSPSP